MRAEALLDEARLRVIHCQVSASVARDRIAQRSKELPASLSVHGDAGLSESFESFRHRFEA